MSPPGLAVIASVGGVGVIDAGSQVGGFWEQKFLPTGTSAVGPVTSSTPLNSISFRVLLEKLYDFQPVKVLPWLPLAHSCSMPLPSRFR